MRRIVGSLYVQVILAIIAGVILGHFWPDLGMRLEATGDGFIKLVKMVIGPIIFLMVVAGIASMGDLKKVGRVGVKARLTPGPAPATSSASRSRAAASTRARTACRACSAASAPRSCPPRAASSPPATPQQRGVGGEVIGFVW